MGKLKSRKLWLSVACLLGSIATAIAGFSTDNQTIVLAGVICGAISSAIYVICESIIDCETAEADASDAAPAYTQDPDAETVENILDVTYREDASCVVTFTDGRTLTYYPDGTTTETI